MDRLAARLLAALVALFLLGCEEAADAGKTAEAPAEVGVIVARPAPIGITSELPGRLEAYRQAEVRARVAGIVTRRLYEEGQDVRAGTVLFQIDPAPLKAALDISRGAWPGPRPATRRRPTSSSATPT